MMNAHAKMDKNLKKEITDRIKALRNQHGFTQEEMAEKVGLEYNSYVKMENAYYLPTIKVLMLLSDIFKVSIDSIIFGNDDKMRASYNDYDKIACFIKQCDIEKVRYTVDLLIDFADMVENIDLDK